MNRMQEKISVLLSLTVCAALFVLAPQSVRAQEKSPADEKKEVLDRLNWFRKNVGLAPVQEDKKLSVGCELHARYLAINEGRKELEDGGGHREERHLMGYSVQGEKSAERSVIGWYSQPKRAYQEVDGLIATLYHRIPLLNPRLGSVGIGIGKTKKGGGVLVIDKKNIDWKKTKGTRLPILLPFPEQREVSLEFCLGGVEWPDPRPDLEADAGYPITAIFPIGSWKPGEAKASLSVKGEKVDCWVSTPERPARKDRPQRRVVCILPKKPLREKTKYTVTVECKQFGRENAPKWSKTWSFTTGAKKDERRNGKEKK